MGVGAGGLPDLAPSSVGGGRRWRARIWEREELGRGPGRCANAVGFIPSSRRVSISTPLQSYRVMGLLLLMVEVAFFFGGGGQRQGGRPKRNPEGSRGTVVVSCFSRVLSVVWLEQLYPYPLSMCLYLYCMYVFLT